jgi:hypothetical protein
MRLQRSHERRGVILMVVMALLTLFAIVGITFVLYADSQATSARISRESESLQHADVDPEQALALFLSQFIYDVNDDASGVGSGLRGHSLARTMYGYNYTTVGIPGGNNVVSFNGVGRVQTGPGTTWPAMNPYTANDYQLVNYTWFSTDGFLRDPERYNNLAQLRTSPAAAQTGYYVGGNAPYTYPDLNNFFLAAVRSDGTVLTPSYHRPWLFGAPLNNMSNPNWINRRGKYLTLRPRPADHAGFPAPDDATGDVKNLVGAPGGNDSIWIDIGAPVMTAPDGTQYKMLVAPLIMDLDNRVNVGVCGNIVGNALASRSNQGWFRSEVNLNYLLNSGVSPNEWHNLFQGNASYYGKYGKNLVPSGLLFPTGSFAHIYGQADLDGRNELAGGASTGSIQLPGTAGTAPANSCFPYFPPGYGSGSAKERANHPAGYVAYKPALYTVNDDHVFLPADMEALLRPNSQGQTSVDTGSSALISKLLRLCPQNLELGNNAYQRRNWITTISSDLVEPGLSPWVFNPTNPPQYLVNAATPSLPPVGTPISFPSFTQRTAVPPPPNPPAGSDFTANWRAVSAALGRIDLNRPLPPFPHMASGATPALVGPNARYDTNPALLAPNGPFQIAMQARQQFAYDIYSRLLLVTGVAPPANPATPTAAELAPRRWLAQLAVNIVDYIDADEISTPFNFYTSAANSYQVTPTTTTIPPFPAGNPDVPAYWVFGTELPRVVINEVLGEYTVTTDLLAAPTAVTGPLTVKLWVELFNPMPLSGTVTATANANTGSPNGLQPQDALPVPLYVPAAGGGTTAYNPYQIVIANNNIAANSQGLWYNAGGTNNNVLGTPQHIRATCNLSAGNGTVGTVAQPAKPTYSIAAPAGGLPGQSFMLVGPPGNDANNDITTADGVPGGTPWLQSPNMQYTATYRAKLKQWQINGVPILDETNGVSVLLRRLANPHLPPNPYTPAGTLLNPALPPNPFITVDYAHGVQLNGYGANLKKQPIPVRGLKVPIPGNGPVPPASYGKRQPYAANFTQYATQTTLRAPINHHTLGLQNVPVDNPFTWLVHLDRKLISPMELLHVSGFYPHELTQRFIITSLKPLTDPNVVQQPSNTTYTPAGKLPVGSVYFQHYVPWFDQTRRLYRIFEFLETHDGASGISAVNGRVPGKININTLWDPPSTYPQMYQAIADPSPTPDNPNFTAANVNAAFQALLTLRTPNLATPALSAKDRPFLGMAAGVAPRGDPQYPTGNGINHTLLTGGAGAVTTGQRLLQLPNSLLPIAQNYPQGAHPYLQDQLLTKISSKLTTRSNTFAVFVTVGFFQVANAATSPPKLGAEIGRSEGRQVRHRMFAIVDRTNLTNFSFQSNVNIAAPASGSTTTATLTFGTPLPPPAPPPLGWVMTGPNSASYTNPKTGATWTIRAGTQLVIEPGTANEETVIVQGVAVNASQQVLVTANFTKAHPNSAVTGNTSGAYSVIQRGNPGPQTTYDPRQDPYVVPYYSIID